MISNEHNAEHDTYRLILVPCQSTRPLAIRGGSWRLPKVAVPTRSRVAEELQRAVRNSYGLWIIVLATPTIISCESHLCIAEVLAGNLPEHWGIVNWEDLSRDDLHQCEILAAIHLLSCTDPSKCAAFSRPGWIKSACEWLQEVRPGSQVDPECIYQYGLGDGFALVRLQTRDGATFWLKATGHPNKHEFHLTARLSNLCPDYLPRLIAVRPAWNAWLMEEAGRPLVNSPTYCSLEKAAQALAGLQIRTIGSTGRLLEAGAFDQRISVLRDRLPEIFEHLVGAMQRQTSTKVAPLSRERLMALERILRNACDRIAALHIPDTLLHNDLSLDNILFEGSRCVFTDWSEAAIGSPFLSFARLCQLSKQFSTSLRKPYRVCWKQWIEDQTFEVAFTLAPLLAMLAYLYGRGDWLGGERAREPQFESYVRSLARHMDREASDPHLLELTCRG